MGSIDVKVVTNSFEITRLPNKDFYQYDVVFNPEIKIARKREQIIHMLQTSIDPDVFHPRGVFDGQKQLFLSHPLNLAGGDRGRWVVSLGGDPHAPFGAKGVYEVKIARTGGAMIRPADLQKLTTRSGQTIRDVAPAINLLQLLIRQALNDQHKTNNGRAFFSPEGKKIIDNSAFELWRGFFQSIRPTKGKLVVTIDTATAAVYQSGPLLGVAMRILGSNVARDLSLSDGKHFRSVQAYLKGRLIKVNKTGDRKGNREQPRERTKTIYALHKGPIGHHTFNLNGSKITIQEYFLRQYGVTLQFPNSFGVEISGQNAKFAVIVPAELCELLPGQLYKKRLPPSAVSETVRFSTQNPRDRLRTITGGTRGIPSPIQTYRNSEYVRDAGMVIATHPLRLGAKLLEPPQMRFRDEKLPPGNGSWNVRRQRFHTAKSLKFWAVVNLGARVEDRVRGDKIREFKACCGKLGMTVADPMLWQADPNALERTLDKVTRSLVGPDSEKIILVLLPDQAEEVRIRVKFWGDVTRGIRTQCIKESVFKRSNDQIFNNWAISGQYAIPEQKVLPWLNQQGKTLVMGADVSHPSPGVSRPSIASLVWSWDAHAASYIAYSRVQEPRTEIIDDLENMVKEAVDTFGAKFGTPRSIIFYRDGVSEGELENVRTVEINGIRSACQLIWKKHGIRAPLPLITYIVVVKRHHSLFFPDESDQRVSDDKGNCRAGLVVDQLPSPLFHDFYLQSHAAIQGTARPAHYFILCDENFSWDLSTIQRLSFDLCHVYAKATRSVSIPAPVYYADLVCARAKFHIDPTLDMDIDGTVASGDEPFNLARWQRAFSPVSTYEGFDKSMYFL